MAFIQYLTINGEALPLPDSYEVGLSAVEAESGGTTEAGTTQRDVIREGVAEISAGFSVSPKWLAKLTGYSKEDSLSVTYFDTGTLGQVTTQMYMSGFKATLKKDTSYGGLWTVSFTLDEF